MMAPKLSTGQDVMTSVHGTVGSGRHTTHRTRWLRAAIPARRVTPDPRPFPPSVRRGSWLSTG